MEQLGHPLATLWERRLKAPEAREPVPDELVQLKSWTHGGERFVLYVEEGREEYQGEPLPVLAEAASMGGVHAAFLRRTDGLKIRVRKGAEHFPTLWLLRNP